MSTAYIGRVLQGIYAENGRLTAMLVVDAARPVGSPLHSRFEWDDTIAGPAYRLQQAGAVIRSVKVVRDDAPDLEPTRVRAFVHLPTTLGEDETDDAATYVPVEVVAGNAEMDALARKEMQRRIQALRRTYASYAAFWEEIHALLVKA